MPITPTYPGVYIEEVPSGVRTITGVATSITAFIGRALRGWHPAGRAGPEKNSPRGLTFLANFPSWRTRTSSSRRTIRA